MPQEQGGAEGGNKVVIVGCGVAGCTLALQLLKKGRDFILINPTDYFHTWCLLQSERQSFLDGRKRLWFQ